MAAGRELTFQVRAVPWKRRGGRQVQGELCLKQSETYWVLDSEWAGGCRKCGVHVRPSPQSIWIYLSLWRKAGVEKEVIFIQKKLSVYLCIRHCSRHWKCIREQTA